MDKRALALVAAGGVAFAAWVVTRPGGVPVDPEEVGQLATDVDALARTIWGEARGEGYIGMQAVANVIMNRAARPGWWGDSVLTVIFTPLQFSMWNDGEANGTAAANVTTADPQFRTALAIAAKAVAGQLPDVTGGATHYFADWIAPPSWAASLVKTVQIGRHIFFKS